MITVYFTCKNTDEAKKISKSLLQKRLIACANLFPIKSMYWWKGKIVNHREVAIVAKTRKEKFEAIKKEVKRLHSYQVPCVVAFEWHGHNSAYASWVREETTSRMG